MFRTTRREFLKNSALVAASASLSQSLIMDAMAADPLKIWTIGVAKVTKTWDEMGNLVSEIFHEKITELNATKTKSN